MTQQIINLGPVPNDGQGDNLRTAFDKTNENFTQIWTAGPVGTNVQIQGNTISTLQVNQDLALSPNGTGNIRLNNNTIPGANNTWFLGSVTNRWRGLYVGEVTAANITVTDGLVVPGDVTIGGNLTVEGDTIQIGNIVTDTKTIQLSNTATTTTAANGSGITVGASDNIATILYNSSGNVWTTNIGITATGNVTAPYFIGNGSQLTGITSYANANAVAYGQAGWAGNIIPSGNAVYSLGNATNQWKSLYVSNATIYLNNVPISLTAGNVLTVNGQDVVTTNANGTVDLANLAIDNNNIYNTQGQGVVISNFSFIDEAETAYIQIPAGNSASDLSVVQTQGNVRLVANAVSWTFNDTGNLTLPTNGSIIVDGGDGVIGPVSDDLVIAWDNEEIRLVSVQGSIEMQADNAFRVQTNYDGGTDTYLSRWEFSQDEIVNITGPSAIVTEAGDLTLSGGRNGLASGNVSVVAVNNGVVVNTWNFDNTGNLTLPPSGNIVGITPNNAGRIQWVGNSSGDGFGYTTLGLVPDDTLVGNDQYLIIDPTAPGHIHIRAGGEQDNSAAELIIGGEYSHFKVGSGANATVYINANSHIWWFNQDGTVQLPPSDYGYAQFYTGGGANLYLGSSTYPVNITGADGSIIAPNNITANGNVTGDVGFFNDINLNNAGTNRMLYVDGDRNIYDTDFSYDAGNSSISGSGNITAGYFIGDGSQLTGLPAQYGDSNVATFLAAYGSNTISTTGNVTAGNFIGAGSNVELIAQSEQWVFDTTGVLTVPGNITGANVVSANTFVSNAFNVVTAGNLSITSQYGLGFTGTILEDNGTLELIGSGAGGVYAGWDSNYGNGLGNIATVSFNEVGGEGILLRTGNRAATEYNWNFDSTGNLTLPTAGYLLVQTGIIGAGASPAPTLSGFSSIATTGSPGNISASGNLIVSGYANITGSINGGNMSLSGNITGNTGGYTIGYRDIPQVTFSANATAALTDAGKHFYSTTAGNLALTLPDNSSVAFPTGATLTIVVNAAGNVLVNQGTGVSLYQAGASTTGNRVVGAYGLASVMKVAANTWVISGTGVY